MSTNAEPLEAAPQAALLALNLVAGLPPRECLARARAALRVGDLAARVTAYYIADMLDRGVYCELGSSTVRHFAEHQLGMGASTAYDYAAAGRALRRLPALDCAFADGLLSWTKVKLLIPVVTPETEETWALWARQPTTRQVARQVRGRSKGDLPSDPARRSLYTVRQHVKVSLSPAPWAVLQNELEELARREGRLVTDQEFVLQALLEKLSRCEQRPRTLLDPRNRGPVVPEELRAPPTSSTLRREVIARDGGRCRCCASKHGLTVHHMRQRRFGGTTTPDNLIALCADCHSLIHADLLVVLGDLTDGLRFVDRKGRPVDAPPPAEPAPRTELRAPEAGGDDPLEPAASIAVTSLSEVPAVASPSWWASHHHLFRRSPTHGDWAFSPGVGRPPMRAPTSASGVKLDEFVGQPRARDRIALAVEAARVEDRPLRHMLLVGPAGLGKTRLAEAIAATLEAPLTRLSAPMIETPDLVLRTLTNLQPGDVVFADEVHALPRRAAEVLYEALDRGRLSLTIRDGATQRSVELRLPPFTFIGATTDEDQLPKPLLSRLQVERLRFYSGDELQAILEEASRRQGFELTPAALDHLAGAARDTPRQGLLLLSAVRDAAIVAGLERVTLAEVQRILMCLEIDADGLDAIERAYLSHLRRADRPLSLRSLAAKLGTSPLVIERLHEPFLMRRGLVQITSRGRSLAA